LIDATAGGGTGKAVDMSDLERLLDVQANDTAADQLRHRRATLPERSMLVEIDREEATIRAEIAEPQNQSDELARTQKRLEDEIATVEGKAAHVEKQLYDGSMTSPKEAQALQADLESLKRRQSSLEDDVLELMEQVEPLDEQLSKASEVIDALASKRATVLDSLRVAEAAVDGELASTTAARQSLVDAVPPALIAEYERLRGGPGGVGVARLQGATCMACHISLAAAEVDVMKKLPADDLAYCPDCGRLLVR
jgi:hypothetical protein